MCGIAGIITTHGDIESPLLSAQKAQGHRGPDAQGISAFQVNRWTIGLGHQRLSIIDLSDAGRQPMISSDGNDCIIYNGEVYNYQEIREELQGIGQTFKSSSDTEVILSSLRQWGIESALERFNGMWAFAWLDRGQRRLILARDRSGVKPLHFYLNKQELFFASELKTILAMANRKFPLNNQVIGEYLLQSLLETTENTFFRDIKKVPAAHYAIVDLNSDQIRLDVRRYWHIPQRPATFKNEDELIISVRDTFFDAVRLRLRSDVPVGVLLSGGIDSSSIAVAMQSILGKDADLNLLAAVSDDPRFDESFFIDIMAKHLGRPVQKVKLDFDPKKVFDYLEQVCWFNDEPVGGFSNVAHFLLMKRAKDLGITVILSGQGSDELTCGYFKFLGFYVQLLLRQGSIFKAGQVLWSFWRQGTVLNQFTVRDAKRYLPPILRPKSIDISGPALREYQPLYLGLPGEGSVLERQKLDFERFSIPVLTHYEDRISMAWAREIRVPFLDYRLVESLLPLPIEWKLRNGWTKFILRKVMEPYLPNEITWRKDKQGFVNPESEWLKNELMPTVTDYFHQDSLMYKFQFVHKDNLNRKYKAYINQPANSGSISFKDIFNPLALEIWLRRYSNYISQN